MNGGISPVRAVTLSVADLAAARSLYQDRLGMRPLPEWQWRSPRDVAVARLWGVPEDSGARGVWLEQPGAHSGAIRLVQFSPVSPRSATDGARPYDHGLVQNLDFCTDDTDGAFARLSEAGKPFLSAPGPHAMPWGAAMEACEAQSEAIDGVTLSIARPRGAPRTAFGEASPATGFTEVAVAAQVVADFRRAVRFYCEAFDCVPAADSVLEDPAWIAARHLPPGTRLRLSVIAPKDAVGGKLGLLAYEGDGVRDARSLSEQARPPHRGAVMLSFETDDVDGRWARALLAGGSGLQPPIDLELPPFGPVRAASLRSPDGITIELVESLAGPRGELLRVCGPGAVAEGTQRGFRVPGLGRLLLANVGGHLFALEDRCPHLGGPLSHGAFDGRRVSCPWHGWRVDVATGRVAGAEGLCARRYALRLRDDGVFVRRPDGER